MGPISEFGSLSYIHVVRMIYVFATLAESRALLGILDLAILAPAMYPWPQCTRHVSDGIKHKPVDLFSFAMSIISLNHGQ